MYRLTTRDIYLLISDTKEILLECSKDLANKALTKLSPELILELKLISNKIKNNTERLEVLNDEMLKLQEEAAK